MKRLLFALIASAAFAPAAANAQLVNIRVDLPEVPPLVVVSPGIQVVENHDEEIFFHDNWYWVRRDGRWYRARHPRHEFVFVEEHVVPRPIYGLPPGHYRHYRHQAIREEHRHHEHEMREHEMREHEMREREMREREMREREMREREEARRFHEREEARRIHERQEAERRHERREERREMRHEERREVHQAIPVQDHPDRRHGHEQGGHENRGH